MVGDQEVGPVGQDREEQAHGDPVGQEGRVPPPEEERRFTKEKEALAKARQWLKW